MTSPSSACRHRRCRCHTLIFLEPTAAFVVVMLAATAACTLLLALTNHGGRSAPPRHASTVVSAFVAAPVVTTPLSSSFRSRAASASVGELRRRKQGPLHSSTLTMQASLFSASSCPSIPPAQPRSSRAAMGERTRATNDLCATTTRVGAQGVDVAEEDMGVDRNERRLWGWWSRRRRRQRPKVAEVATAPPVQVDPVSATALFPIHRRRQRKGGTISSAIAALFVVLVRRVVLKAPSAAFAAAKSGVAVAPRTALTFFSSPRSLVPWLTTRIASTVRSCTATRRDAIRSVAVAFLVVSTLLAIVDVVSTRKRQSIDATSEWGRYADQPAARGRALMALLIRLAPYAVAPSLLNRLPGGGRVASDEKKKKTKQERKEDERKKKRWAARSATSIKRQGGALFADGLLRLGPLYIKIGQILSCRENLLPDEWIVALERLQDRVPAKSGSEAMELAYEAFPGGSYAFQQAFKNFDDVPLAAASLGQVHRAELRSNGAPVAIKVQRPRLRDIYDKDLALMHKIAKAVDKFGGKAGQVGGVKQSWDEIFTDAEVILYREIDYRDEAENAIRFANDFGLGLNGTAIQAAAKAADGKPLPSASDWLRTPYVYSELSSEKVLTMEFVPSIKVNNDTKLDLANVTVEDREYLAESLARAYLRQFCTHKFFSTDPHPGNLGVEVRRRGMPPRLVFYDFGQACSLSEDQSGGILDVIESIVDMDAKKSVAAFDKMGVLVEDADLDKVERKVQNNYETGKIKVKKRKLRKSGKYGTKIKPGLRTAGETASLVKNSTTSIATKSNETSTEASQSNATKASGGDDPEVMEFFVLRSEYAFVARAISQMDGVGKGLDPEFDFISASAPYLVEVKGATKYLRDEAKKFVFDLERKFLDWEMKIMRTFGFDPSLYLKEQRDGGIDIKNIPSNATSSLQALNA